MGWSHPSTVQSCSGMLFQSLRGFGVGWSQDALAQALHDIGFQSLRGFGVGWSSMAVRWFPRHGLFQSLRGFGVGWSSHTHSVTESYLNVVSIPERVWGGLEPQGRKHHSVSGKFQSLRGFGVGWSFTDIQSGRDPDRFNP